MHLILFQAFYHYYFSITPINYFIAFAMKNATKNVFIEARRWKYKDIKEICAHFFVCLGSTCKKEKFLRNSIIKVL